MNIDTDLEIQRYQEATDMLSHAFNPEELVGLPRQYNPLSRRNLIMQELPSGGYVQVGEEDLPQPQVMSTAPQQPTGLTRLEEAQKLRDSFKKRGYTLTQEDLEAAGLGDVVFDDVPDPRPQEVATEQIQREGPGQLKADPTIRDNLHNFTREVFMNIGDYLGYIPGIPTNVEFQNFKIPEPMAEQLAGFVSGRNNLGVGAGDFVGLGSMTIEEGARTFEVGAQNDDKLLMALGALEYGLGVAEALPAFKPLSQGIKEGLRIVRQRLNQPGPMPTVGSNFGNVFAPSAKLTNAERNSLKAAATKNGKLDNKLFQDVKTEALRIKNAYAVENGWLPISINVDAKGPVFTVNKEGKIEIKWREPAYGFHIPTDKTSKEAHKQNLIEKTVSDVSAVVQRAQNGDQAAVDIINQANWYRAMRSRLRTEFGGLADVFADILGATSAQTNVQQNYENSLDVLRRFVRGDFDSEIAEYEKIIAAGDPRGSALYARDRDANDSFRLIRKASGALYNTNSPAATEALLNMFRQVKAGQSPKTINFTGNLIGFGNEATIDVWAARYLRDIAGLPRIPPPAEKAVAGKHLTASTLEEPRIGGEFGFGQDVFRAAATALNQAGQIKAFNPELGDLGPDDLQAIVWFLEKEKWTQNGWTSKAGEGGSMDYESVFGGSPDRERVKELRSTINRAGSTPEEIASAKEELSTLEGEPQRFVAGISRERPNQIPTNVEQAELASELTAPLRTDNKVIGFQANNTLGEFMGDTERALNFEIVTQTDFDPTSVTRSLVEAGRKYDQDAVFMSKVVPDGTPNARPGVEVYFKERQGVDYAQKITTILREKGIDGFTFVTDARQFDRVDVQALTDDATAGLVGIRFQYIPEFDDGFDPANAAQIFADKADELQDVMDEVAKIEGITYADVVNYETQVYKNTDRPGTEWITGGTSYDEYLGATIRTGAGQGQN